MVRSPAAARHVPRLALLLALAAPGALPATADAATAVAWLTLADGPVELLRGTQRHAADVGLALAGNDLLRTGALTRVARVEFADGRVLDLGPNTQALLPTAAAAAAAGLPVTTAVVVQGWAKLTVPAAVNAGPGAGAHLAAPGLTLQAPPAGAVLLHVAADGTLLVFAESRGALLSRRMAGSTALPEATLREGDAWVREAGAAAGARAAGLAALRQVPAALADTLPRRAARMPALAADPAPGEPLWPADLVAWNRAEPALMAVLRPRARAGASAGATLAAATGARRDEAVPRRLAAARATRPAAFRTALPAPAELPQADKATLEGPGLLSAVTRSAGTAGLPALAAASTAAPASARVARSDAVPTPSDAPRRR